MTVYAALLRAIGPASHAKMRPSALRDRAEEAGFERPVNYLATGNLIFGSAKSKAEVRREIAALVEGFGLTSEVFIVTLPQMRSLVAATPLPEATHDRPDRVGVCFFHRTLKWPEALLHPDGPELVVPVGATLVIDYGPGTAASKLRVEKLAGATMTQRNWNTVLGVLERMQDHKRN